MIQRPNMGVGDIRDVDIVPKAGTVGRLVIRTVDVNGCPIERRGDHERNQVCLRIVLLADFAVRIGARGIEIAQRNPGQAIGYARIGQHLFDKELRPAIRIYRPQRMFL